jgi:hypothetical protein
MSGSRWARYTALLAAGVLLVALIAPAVAFAAAGEPVEGAEVYLSEQYENDDIVADANEGGVDVNSNCNISWSAGTFAGATNMTATVGYSATGVRATDNGIVKRVVLLQPNGLTPLKNITLTLTCPPGLSNARMYWLNPGTGKFEPQSSSKSGNKVTTEIGHFSIYGVGGDEAVTSTPASSNWSLAVLAVAGMALGAFVLRRARHATTGIGV